MKKKFIALLATCVFFHSLPAQTLFTYAGNKVDVKEFLHAYNKTNGGEVVPNKEKSIREYLDMYINSRLKIHEAYEKKYDTGAVFQEELSTLRLQVLENYMTDPATYRQLAEEAWSRSQKDILVQHIFIPYQADANHSDSAMALLKIREAHLALRAGKNFEEVALKYSADPAVTENKGTIGFITAFSLPYQFENIIYRLSPGQFSEPFKSKTGYHIFKNVSERKAVGSIRVAHILLALPPGSSSEEIKKTEWLADSLYQRVLQGDDFAKLAAQFSNDYISAASGGQLPEFFPGTYDPAFENTVFSLSSDGAVSKPFHTAYGIHIVKRIAFTPPPAQSGKQAMDYIKPRLDKDDRVQIAKEALINQVKSKAGFKLTMPELSLLKAFVDSVLENKPVPVTNRLNKKTVLLKTGDEEKTTEDLIAYAQDNQWYDDPLHPESFAQLTEDFIRSSVLAYYKNHLEEYNEEFRELMKELKEGNLFFDIMMNEVWNKAQSDSIGQAGYYNRHRKNYMWNKSADAIIFYCGKEETASILREELQKAPDSWKNKLEEYTDRATADSGRYEWKKIPGLKSTTPVNGMWTAIETNPNDHSAAFARIIRIYTQAEQKSFADARSDVIADYQNELDNKWVAALRKKYPVQVDEKVLQAIIQQK